MFRVNSIVAAILVASLCVLSVMPTHAGIFGMGRSVQRSRISQPRSQSFRQQIFVPHHQQQIVVRQQFVVPHVQQQIVVPYVQQQVIVPRQQIIVPQAILQPNQTIIYGSSGALILQ